MDGPFKVNPLQVFHSLVQEAEWHDISNKKKGRWKISFHFSLIFLLLLCTFQPASGEAWDGVIITQADYQALEAFKHELVDPKGFLRSWNDSGLGACSGGWVGIKCAQGQVIVIQLPWKGLGGRVTEKIGQLQALRKLSLHDNAIGGAIPSSLGFLPNLRGVQLFNNRFSGSIPPTFGLCPLLQTLDFSNNVLTGTIPPSVANSTRLLRFNLSYNSLSGSIPAGLTQSQSLIFLSLQHNNLSGPIPDSWGGNVRALYQLQSLTLDHNSFSGTIPASFANLSELQEISVSHNNMAGVIPNEIGKLSRLTTLDFSYNALNGSLPAGLYYNLSYLVTLNLESNHLDNQIPDGINKLQKLSVLNLRNNQFTGPILAAVGNISTLTQLDLSHNNLSGEIPTSLGDLPSLSSFNVSYNNLSGPVPTKLSQKFNASAFVGNLQLCGYSASSPCPVPPSPAPSHPPETPTTKHHKLGTKDILLIAAGTLLVILLVLCCILIFLLFRKRSDATSKNGQAAGKAAAAATGSRAGPKGVPPTAGEETSGEAGGKLVHFDGPLVFTADDLLCATAEIMGKSTYGTVYKATLEDGSVVAVKRLREKITKGQREFETEVNVLGKIRHRNLLAMRAYYLGPKGEKLLVFDYMPKGSLATFLHARGPDTPIDWPTRMRIAQGMARGLLYLHTQDIFHGNLTSSNVLLDENTNAKISDYGLSRLMTPAANANVIATAGALGYRAPELSKSKKANTKTDVYSLGVIMLELLTGKSPGEAMNGVDLPQWVASIVKEESTNEVFDLELMRDASTIGDELLNTLKLVLHCVDPSPSARPEIQQVLQQLEEIRAETAASTSEEVGAVPSSTSD